MKLQIQTIIYDNRKEDLYKSLEYVACAIRYYLCKSKEIKVTLKYGDASPRPILTDNDVIGIKERYISEFNFSYFFFNNNTGTALGHNLLEKDSDSDFLIIMNPDIILQSESLYQMMSYMDKTVGIVEARQIPVEHHKEYNKCTFETGWASTACALVATKAFRAVHGFDSDSFFLYCDDVDFSWRIRLAGYSIKYCPRALAFHAKRFINGNQWETSKLEYYYSTEGALMLAYKYSKNRLFRKILKISIKSDNDACRKAAKAVLARKSNGKMPLQIHKSRKVCYFKNGYYFKNRYIV